MQARGMAVVRAFGGYQDCPATENDFEIVVFSERLS
jgi:hypothetical protein